MKKFEMLGRSLSKDEQKSISGGLNAPARTVCSCDGGPMHGAAMICMGNILACWVDAMQLCSGGTALCNSASNPA